MKTLLLDVLLHLVGHPLSQAMLPEEDSVTVGIDGGDGVLIKKCYIVQQMKEH